MCAYKLTVCVYVYTHNPYTNIYSNTFMHPYWALI